MRRGMAGIFIFIILGLILTASYLLEEGRSSEFLKNLPISNLGADEGPKGKGTNNNGNGNNGFTPGQRPDNGHPPPRFKPTPTWVPPPVKDPLPLLSQENPPPIPSYNVPRMDLHTEYGLSYMPPLFIGFTRHWPMLLQCVVSYINAGWPPESIIVVENTGVQMSNKAGKLSLQNPFYLNHAALKKLGVNVLQTPVLLTFSQMQNFFLATAHERAWPQYFYSHQDVLVYSFEDGADSTERPGDREWFFYDDDEKHDVMHPAAAGQKGYRTIYENSLRELNVTLEKEERWAFRWFQYDHLTLVNREALDAVGGYDNLMPYYGSDCDLNARLAMDGWSMKHRRVGIINDVSSVLENLLVLYRDTSIEPVWVDPNPGPEKPPPEETPEEPEETTENHEESIEKQGETLAEGSTEGEAETPAEGEGETPAESGGEAPAEGEGETPTEGEGEAPVEGEGEAPAEGDALAEGEEQPTEKKLRRRQDVGEDVTALERSLEYFRKLVRAGNEMGRYKYRDTEVRNLWQMSQRGGQGEPYYYNSDGFSKGFWILAEAGREVFKRKWGHEGCDLVAETALIMEDAWLVEADWEKPPEPQEPPPPARRGLLGLF